MSSNTIKQGFIQNDVYIVSKNGKKYNLVDTDGKTVGTHGVTPSVLKRAFEKEMAIQGYTQSNGSTVYKVVNLEKYNSLVYPMNTETNEEQKEEITSHEAIKEYIHSESIRLKPDSLVMKELKWKYLVRSAVRAKNIMMTGPSGCGKTMAAKSLVKALDRPDFYFNLGATQDPRATLVGNTTFKSESGTKFVQSAFVTAIQTPNAVILLDELSRAHPDAWNILMTVLDQSQRYLRLDEEEGSPIIKVADGVTFIATANIGTDYTATRVIDRAILDRFVTIEMDVLNDEEEFDLLSKIYPQVDTNVLKALSEIAHDTRRLSSSSDGKLTSMISTRITVETAGLIYDGFSLTEAAEIAILPFFDSDGDIDSERTYVKQMIQKYQTQLDEKGLYSDVVDADDIDSKIDLDIPAF